MFFPLFFQVTRGDVYTLQTQPTVWAYQPYGLLANTKVSSHI